MKMQVAVPQAAQAGAALRRRASSSSTRPTCSATAVVGRERRLPHERPDEERAYEALFAGACNGSHYVSNGARRRAGRRPRRQPGGGPGRGARRPAPPARPLVAGMGGGMGGMDGALQALLTEMSGLKKPRGFFSRRCAPSCASSRRSRRSTGSCTSWPRTGRTSLDDALLRPGRIDRIYKVGYPHVDGRRRTYEGYLDKVKQRAHARADRPPGRHLARTPRAPSSRTSSTRRSSSPCATVATSSRGPTCSKAKHHQDARHARRLDATELERHQVAIHEACHAVAMYRLQKRSTIDVATIERAAARRRLRRSIPLEERFTEWRTELRDRRR